MVKMNTALFFVCIFLLFRVVRAEVEDLEEEVTKNIIQKKVKSSNTSNSVQNTDVESQFFQNVTQNLKNKFTSTPIYPQNLEFLEEKESKSSLNVTQKSDLVSDIPPHVTQETQIESVSSTHQTLSPEKKISETIMTILQHYKQPDPLGIPVVPIPDPMTIPDMKRSFSVGRMFFNNVRLYGLKKLRIEHVVVNVSEMKVEACLSIDVLSVKGNYTLNTWISRASGPFVVKLGKVQITALATMEVEINGTLEAQNMDMDITYATIDMDFQDLGYFAQGMMSSVGAFVFDSIKPFILSQANTDIRNQINKEIKKFQMKFSNSIAPVDQLIYEIRKTVRSKGYDPYYVQDYNTTVGLFDMRVSHTWLYGLSFIYRTKDMKLELQNNTLHMSFEVSTGTLIGTTNWEMSLIPNSMYRDGTVAFTVSYFKVKIDASQSMDTSHPPSLDDIQLELGNIQMRFNGLGSMDYLIEFGVNIIPNVLRNQIMDAIERPIKIKIQETLDQVNVEGIIMQNADQLDSGKGLENFHLVL